MDLYSALKAAGLPIPPELAAKVQEGAGEVENTGARQAPKASAREALPPMPGATPPPTLGQPTAPASVHADDPASAYDDIPTITKAKAQEKSEHFPAIPGVSRESFAAVVVDVIYHKDMEFTWEGVTTTSDAITPVFAILHEGKVYFSKPWPIKMFYGQKSKLAALVNALFGGEPESLHPRDMLGKICLLAIQQESALSKGGTAYTKQKITSFLSCPTPMKSLAPDMETASRAYTDWKGGGKARAAAAAMVAAERKAASDAGPDENPFG